MQKMYIKSSKPMDFRWRQSHEEFNENQSKQERTTGLICDYEYYRTDRGPSRFSTPRTSKLSRFHRWYRSRGSWCNGNLDSCQQGGLRHCPERPEQGVVHVTRWAAHRSLLPQPRDAER